MAHFAEIDENNIVLRVVVVANADIKNDSGDEVEMLGIKFLRVLFGQETRWVQTSYSGTFRKNYAGIYYTYDAARDAFIPPEPEGSLGLDETTCQWIMME